MQTVFSSSCFLDRDISEWTGCVQGDHAALFCFLNRYVIIDLLLAHKELFGSSQGQLGVFNTWDPNVIKQTDWLNYSNKEDSADLTWLAEETFVILLFLPDVKSIFTPMHALS